MPRQALPAKGTLIRKGSDAYQSIVDWKARMSPPEMGLVTKLPPKRVQVRHDFDDEMQVILKSFRRR